MVQGMVVDTYPLNLCPLIFIVEKFSDFSCKELRHSAWNDHVTVVMVEEWGRKWRSGGGNGGVGPTYATHTTVLKQLKHRKLCFVQSWSTV